MVADAVLAGLSAFLSLCLTSVTNRSFACVMQIVLGVFLSLSYGANTAHTSFGVLAIMRYIHTSGCLTATANLGIKLRCVSAIGTAIGALVFGRRLAPITGDTKFCYVFHS